MNLNNMNENGGCGSTICANRKAETNWRVEVSGISCVESYPVEYTLLFSGTLRQSGSPIPFSL